MGNQSKTTPAHDTKADRTRKGDHTQHTSGGSGGFLLSASGMLMILAAIVVDVSPRFLPQFNWVQRSAIRRGLTPGSLGLTGLMVFAMGWVMRASRAPKTDGKTESDRGLVLEQVAVDLAQMRGGMQELRVDFVFLKEASQSLLTAIRDGGAGGSNRDQQDAMFRLAASLDQVGERLDQRIQTQQTFVQQSIGSLQESITSMRTQMTDLSAMSTRMQSMTGGSMSDGSWPGESQNGRGHGRRGEVDVWVELEEGDDTSLGLLDTLDEYGQAPKHRTSMKGEPHSMSSGTSRPIMADQDMLQAPLPNRRAQAMHPQMMAQHAGAVPQNDASVGSMIESLRMLLSDSRVRHALETMSQPTRDPS